MSVWGFLQICGATVVFLAAAVVAKQWAMAPHWGKVVLALALYSAGNLIMLKLVRDFGMATLSACPPSFNWSPSTSSDWSISASASAPYRGRASPSRSSPSL